MHRENDNFIKYCDIVKWLLIFSYVSFKLMCADLIIGDALRLCSHSTLK